MKISEFEEVILASASPRRKSLLEGLGLSVCVMISDIEEKIKPTENILDYVLRNAREKGLAIGKQVTGNRFIISADTIVVTKDNELLEKPQSHSQAYEMLSKLSDETHLVYTAYAICQQNKVLVEKYIETKVTFRKLSDDEIYEYIVTGEPFDKAGAYGIQGPAMGFVDKIEGSYTNVMGLPLSQLLVDLYELKK